jgi:hypothetical protein
VLIKTVIFKISFSQLIFYYINYNNITIITFIPKFAMLQQVAIVEKSLRNKQLQMTYVQRVINQINKSKLVYYCLLLLKHIFIPLPNQLGKRKIRW